MNNRYNVATQSVCNLPWVEEPEASPKLMALVYNVIKQAEDGAVRQVVYSSRVERGVAVIAELLRRKSSTLKLAIIDGSVSSTERTKTIKVYNTSLAQQAQYAIVHVFE